MGSKWCEYIEGSMPNGKRVSFTCECGKVYGRYTSLWNHKTYRCGKQPQFSCPFCDHRTWHKCNLKSHVMSKHPREMDFIDTLRSQINKE